MRNIGIGAVSFAVLAILNSEVLTLAIVGLAVMYGAFKLLCVAGEIDE